MLSLRAAPVSFRRLCGALVLNRGKTWHETTTASCQTARWVPFHPCSKFSTGKEEHTGGAAEQAKHARRKVDDFEIFELDAYETIILGHFPGGFTIGNTDVHGSVLLFPRSYYHWSVTDPHALTAESLTMLWVHNPKPEILLLGCGETMPNIGREVLDAIREQGIVVDVMSTVHAAATFNILNSERRNVAAALISMQDE